MRRLPQPSAASLPSAFLSVLVHSAAIITTLIALPAATPLPVTAQVYVPVELVTVADTTNLTEIPPAEIKLEELVEAAAAENAAAPPPAPPQVEEDAISLDPPKDKPKDEPKKTEAKPAPAKAQNDSWSLDDALKSAEDFKKSQSKSNAANTAPASAPETPRISAGDKRRMTASITDIITSQLRDKGCWADHSDMADAKRLRATYRVWFGRNGKFSQPPELIEPTRKPANDPPLNTYIVHAERALSMCNQKGWFVPEDYFRLPQPTYLDIVFLPSIGANQ